MNTVTLLRKIDDGIETQGVLNFNNFSCQTLELPWKNNASNISCVPLGTYNCIWSYIHSLSEYHYQLQGVKDRTGVFIHEGNYNTDVQGCILLGNSYGDINNDGETDILNSRTTLAKFEALMKQQSFTLKVVQLSNNQNKTMKKVYEISSISTTVTYNRYDLDDNGVKIPEIEDSTGTVVYDHLPTMEEVTEKAKASLDPAQNIEVVVAPGVEVGEIN